MSTVRLRLRSWVRLNWGLALLCAFSLLSLVKLLRQAVPGHYRVFVGAGHALWSGQNPYGTDFGTSVGYYFYSPTCALTIFGPLSYLPEKLGLIIYMSAAWAIFVWGARRLWVAFDGERWRLQWFWALITAQVVGAILASKLELAIVGLLMGSVGVLKSLAPDWRKRTIAAAVALAAILNWKFQPLPVIGLVVLSWILIWRELRIPLVIGAALAAWYALPFAFFDTTFLREIHSTWRSTFTPFVSGSVLNFDNVFASLYNAGFTLSFEQTQLTSAVIGFVFAAGLGAWILRTPASEARNDGAFMSSLALGTLFMTALSPLGQNNALVLYAPLLMMGLTCYYRTDQRLAWRGLLLVCVGVMAFAYSDLVPFAAREELRHFAIKSWACVALGLAVWVEVLRKHGPEVRRAASNCQL